MAEHGAHGAHTEFTEHIVPLKVYVGVFLALLIGTALTTGVAYIDLGRWNTVAALAIAVVKMLFVVLFFMHVKYNPGLTRIIIVGAFFWLGIMICFSMADELTRSWEYNPASWTGMILPYVSRFLL
jgi:cytochrome c oxidase subunit 4